MWSNGSATSDAHYTAPKCRITRQSNRHHDDCTCLGLNDGSLYSRDHALIEWYAAVYSQSTHD